MAGVRIATRVKFETFEMMFEESLIVVVVLKDELRKLERRLGNHQSRLLRRRVHAE